MELTPLSYVLFWLRNAIICLQLWRVVLGHPALVLSFILRFRGTFPLLQIQRSKVSFLLFKFLHNLDSVLVHRVKQGDVYEIHLILDVSM